MVYGIKTDCLLIEEDITLLSKLIKFDTVIGGVKYEYGKKNQSIEKYVCLIMILLTLNNQM